MTGVTIGATSGMAIGAMTGATNGMAIGAMTGVTTGSVRIGTRREAGPTCRPRQIFLWTIALLFVAGSATADPVAVKVVDVAGGAVYLSPGRAAGIVPGTKVRLRGVEVVIVEVTEKTAVARLAGARVAVGDSGTADVTPGAAPATVQLEKPRPPEAFAGQWSDPVLPATRQSPRPVPLATARRPTAAHVAVTGHAFAATDRDRTTGDAEGRLIAAFELMTERPLTAELDVAGRWFSDGSDGRARTPLFVRAAQLAYGAPEDPRLAVGRLRFAAASVGMLDGGRASARLGSVELAAFGGLVPDPLSGKPDTAASRFGAELVYDAPEAAHQPRLAVAAHGSTWGGRLDERRLSIAASGTVSGTGSGTGAGGSGAPPAGRGALWLDGWAELDAFPSDNPWGAPSLELTGAGATAEWRRHGTHAGLDVTFLRPERSLRLAALLPPEWLCTLAPAPGSAAGEACASGTWWASATASLGTRTPRWALDAVATLGDTHGQYRGLDRSGYVRGELRAGPARLHAAVAGGQASFASWTALELGAAFAPTRALDVAVAYRPEVRDYAASTETQLVHSVIADAHIALSSALDLAISAIGTLGRADRLAGDGDALALLAMFAWRPLP